MRKMKHSLLLVATVILCSQFFSSCSSSKMTQAEVAEYYKDLKITGKGINAQTANTVKANVEIQSETLVKEEITTPVEVNTALTLEETPVITASTEEVILATDTPVFTPTPVEQQANVNPVIESVKEKMDILATNSSLSKKEKRTMKKEVRKTLMKEIKVQKKAMKEAKKSGQEINDGNGFVQLIFAFLIPPLSVAISRGIGSTFWLNLLLTILFFIPGVIHALIVYGEDN